MNTYENLLTRRSIRKYKEKEVEKEKLERIAQAGTFSATGRNRQSPKIIVVTNKALRDRLSKLNAKIMGMDEGDPFYGAPAVIIVLADKSCPTYIYDGSIVMANLMTACYEEGLGSCWIHRAREEFELDEGKAILKELGIEGDYEGIGHCIVGYADENPTPSERKKDYICFAE